MTNDNPHVEARNFLFKVMRDTSLPVEDRIDAAGYLILIDRAPVILDQIFKFGELGLREYFESLPPAEQAELINAVNGLLRCNALGIDRPLDHIPIKGHA